MKSFIYITLLLIISISSRDVLLCSDDGFKDEQCMKREKLGSNTFYWVKKCKGSKVCVDLPYYGEMIGACSIKVRSHYDGESCANDNKCTTGVCDGTKCKGKSVDKNCEVGLGQCKKGLLCRLKDKNAKYTTCQAPIDNDKECTDLYPKYDPTDTYTIDYYYPRDPAYNPCKLGYVCSTKDSTSTKYCVEIGKLAKGKAVTNPLACASGYSVRDECVDLKDAPLTNRGPTSKGAYITVNDNYTDMFNAWKDEVSKNKMKDEDAIYEAYRYTRNKKKVNKAWFIYTHYVKVYDTDDCTFDYLWKRNNGNALKYSLMIFVLILLF